jgi:PadR family transcriptional regulator PadR
LNNKPQGDALAGLPRDYLRAGLLLLIAEAPAYGYDLLEQMRGLGFRANDPGGLYRALRAMEREGYVNSSWDHSGPGPARRTYHLSEEGAEALRSWADVLRQASGWLAAYLARYDELVGETTGSPGGQSRAAPS